MILLAGPIDPKSPELIGGLALDRGSLCDRPVRWPPDSGESRARIGQLRMPGDRPLGPAPRADFPSSGCKLPDWVGQPGSFSIPSPLAHATRSTLIAHGGDCHPPS